MKSERMDPLEFKNALEKRTRDFAVSVFMLLDALPKKSSTKIIAYQLGKSASSIGANYREANHAESRDDFYHKVSISVKEATESCYWLEILVELFPMHAKLKSLRSESRQLLALFESIGRSVKKKKSC